MKGHPVIKTKEKLLGQRIFIESTGNDKVDEALVTIFHDDYRSTAPLEMSRPDVKLAMAWQKGEVKSDKLF